MKTKKLYRSRTDSVLGGVCGGLAKYSGIDANLIRILTVIASIAGSFGIWVYIILALVIPKEPLEMTDGNALGQFDPYYQNANPGVYRTGYQDPNYGTGYPGASYGGPVMPNGYPGQNGYPGAGYPDPGVYAGQNGYPVAGYPNGYPGAGYGEAAMQPSYSNTFDGVRYPDPGTSIENIGQPGGSGDAGAQASPSGDMYTYNNMYGAADENVPSPAMPMPVNPGLAPSDKDL